MRPRRKCYLSWLDFLFRRSTNFRTIVVLFRDHRGIHHLNFKGEIEGRSLCSISFYTSKIRIRSYLILVRELILFAFYLCILYNLRKPFNWRIYVLFPGVLRGFSMLFIIFFFSRPNKERERMRRREKKRAMPRSSPACKNIQYPLVRQLVKYCARAVFRYAFRETNLPRTCYGGFHGIFDR